MYSPFHGHSVRATCRAEGWDDAEVWSGEWDLSVCSWKRNETYEIGSPPIFRRARLASISMSRRFTWKIELDYNAKWYVGKGVLTSMEISTIILSISSIYWSRLTSRSIFPSTRYWSKITTRRPRHSDSKSSKSWRKLSGFAAAPLYAQRSLLAIALTLSSKKGE